MKCIRTLSGVVVMVLLSAQWACAAGNAQNEDEMSKGAGAPTTDPDARLVTSMDGYNLVHINKTGVISSETTAINSSSGHGENGNFAELLNNRVDGGEADVGLILGPLGKGGSQEGEISDLEQAGIIPSGK